MSVEVAEQNTGLTAKKWRNLSYFEAGKLHNWLQTMGFLVTLQIVPRYLPVDGCSQPAEVVTEGSCD
jgi:hypothetical protein